MSDGNPELLVSLTQFADALAEASTMDDATLQRTTGAGQPRSYYVRSGDRKLSLKAVLRLAYLNSGIEWNRLQSELAARRLRDNFDIVHEPNEMGDFDTEAAPKSLNAQVGKVYIANFGEGNSLWPVAKANSTIITIDHVAVHPFWQAGDREGYIEAALGQTLTSLGKRPSRPTAGRWYNLVTEMHETEGDLWISRQGEAIWWTISQPGSQRETIRPSTNPSRDGAEIWNIEKPCLPWSNRDQQGRPLLWEALHPKARDFLSTEATFQTIRNDRGYADYALTLIAGGSLVGWHESKPFRDKAASSNKRVGRTFSPKEIAANRMAKTMMATVAQSNGQTTETKVKEKSTTLGLLECEALLRQKMGEQEDRCALTGLPLGYDNDCEDKEMLASLDRIDSDGHYTPENLQIVCRFINRWKGADKDELVRRLLILLRE